MILEIQNIYCYMGPLDDKNSFWVNKSLTNSFINEDDIRLQYFVNWNNKGLFGYFMLPLIYNSMHFTCCVLCMVKYMAPFLQINKHRKL